jgi:hypothetical protein
MLAGAIAVVIALRAAPGRHLWPGMQPLHVIVSVPPAIARLREAA